MVLHSPQASAIPPQDRERVHDLGNGFGEEGVARTGGLEHELRSVPDAEAALVVVVVVVGRSIEL